MTLTKKQKAENKRKMINRNVENNPLSTYEMQKRKILATVEKDEDFARI